MCHPVLFVSVINCVCVLFCFVLFCFWFVCLFVLFLVRLFVCFVFGSFVCFLFCFFFEYFSSCIKKKARYSIPPSIIDSSATEKQVLTSPCEAPSSDCGSLAVDGDYDSCFRTQGKYTLAMDILRFRVCIPINSY